VKVSLEGSGSFDKTTDWLKKLQKLDIRSVLEAGGRKGAAALARATPIDSSRTANSWGYEVTRGANRWTITWTNSDVENGFPVAVMIQYGHGTGTGGYVQGIDYINPALRPIFDEIAETVWKAVISA
jgi:hypothetical protein